MIDLSYDAKIESTVCKELHAVHCLSNGFLGGPHTSVFQHKNMQITINQLGKREIFIQSEKDTTVYELIETYQNVEKLLMLFDGRFIPLETISFNGAEELVEQYIKRRLQYYQSAAFNQYSFNKLLDFDSVITEDLYNKWINLLDEADIMHQLFLYAMADKTFTNDVKLAFLIETAEPMIELIKDHTFYFTTLMPGERGTSLKMCVDGLITTYGLDIFNNELKEKPAYDKFLSKSVNTRVQIMHIKRNFNKECFGVLEYILYLIKYSVLYRRIILELLDVPYSSYLDNIKDVINKWEEWYNQNQH